MGAKSIFLACAGSGIALAFAGALLGVVMKRPDVSRSTVLMAGSQLGSRTEAYVRPSFVKPVKALNMAGVCLFLAGILIAVWVSVTGGRFE
jgi:hypothetical protein